MPEPIQMIPSEHLTTIQRKTFDIPYASISPAQKLDVYLPEKGQGPFPVIVSIHGGAFMFGDKRDMQTFPMLPSLPSTVMKIMIYGLGPGISLSTVTTIVTEQKLSTSITATIIRL